MPTPAHWVPIQQSVFRLVSCIGNRSPQTLVQLMQNSTTTMVKESFTAGNKQVSPKGQAGYLMRGY